MFHLETNLHSWCLFHCRVGKNQSVVIRVINPPLKLTKTPLKIGPAPKGKFIFQPSIFRCYWWFRNPANHLGCTKPCKEWDKQLVLDSQVPAVSFKEGSSKLDLRPILEPFCPIPSHLWLQVWVFSAVWSPWKFGFPPKMADTWLLHQFWSYCFHDNWICDCSMLGKKF